MKSNDSLESSKKLLFTKQEAMEMLGVGEKTFRGLGITYISIGKRKRYALSDLQAFITRSRQAPGCLSPAKGKGRRTTGTTSRSEVYDIEEARRLIASKLRKQS